MVYIDNHGAMLADSITYRALFSVFASILLGFSLIVLWLGDKPLLMMAFVDSLEQVVPGISDFFSVEDIHAPVGFTVAGIVSLVGLIVAAVGAINSYRVALQVLADETGTEGSPVITYLRDLVVSLGVGILLGVASLGTLATTIGLGTIAHQLGISEHSAAYNLTGRLIGVVIVYSFDVVAIAMAYRVLSTSPASRKLVWKGAALGGVGLVVLQEFSGLFVRGAGENPLLASFASLIALLLWFNFSAQVILLASSWIIVGVQESGPDAAQWKHVHTIEQWKLLRARERAAASEKELDKTISQI